MKKIIIAIVFIFTFSLTASAQTDVENLLAKALQQANNEVEASRALISAQKAQIGALEAQVKALEARGEAQNMLIEAVREENRRLIQVKCSKFTVLFIFSKKTCF